VVALFYVQAVQTGGFMDALKDKKSFIDESLKQKKPVTIEAVEADNEFVSSVDHAFSEILKIKNYRHLHSPLSFVLREFITNANKANLKRIYFNQNGYNIENQEEYQKGMESFSFEIRDNPEKYAKYLQPYKMFIKVIFQEYSSNIFSVYIINKALLTQQEEKRIKEKLGYYKEHLTAHELLDQTEGAGMGIFLSLKMMEQVGIPPNAYSIGMHKGFTVAKISFDYSKISPPPYTEVALEILNQLSSLPKFPDNIKKLLAKLLKEDVMLDAVAADIQKDPTLATDILKLVNSAKFSLTRKISSLKEAVNLVGIKGLKNILYSYGAISVIDNRFGTVEEVWNHCYRVGQISTELAKLKKIDTKDDVFFTAGLLHDLGKIVLMSFDKETAKKIESVCREKDIDIPIMEEIMMGLSHARIGGQIAEFWEFPKNLVDPITHHHDPAMTDDNYEVVYTVHVANYLEKASRDDIYTLFGIEEPARDFFGINSDDDIKALVSKLKSIK
jgi:putative nucleotidyltransferase with HDIG domain